jgi:hypothetical protein
MDQDLLGARRKFLLSCGKFAVVTPPLTALLLAGTERNYAVAASDTTGGFVSPTRSAIQSGQLEEFTRRGMPLPPPPPP